MCCSSLQEGIRECHSNFVRVKQDIGKVVHHGLKNVIQMKLVKCVPHESIASAIISFPHKACT